MILSKESAIYKPGAVDHGVTESAKTATKYIAEITNNGIEVHPPNVHENRVEIDANGMNIYKGGSSVASYGDSARIGKSATTHTNLSSGGMYIYGSNGSTRIAQLGYGNGRSETQTNVPAPYYTLGTRSNESASTIGNWSMANGTGLVASGHASHAEGTDTTASGHMSHAEGSNTQATGILSRAAGTYSVASGAGAYADGYHVTAQGDWQTVLGVYNVPSGANGRRLASDKAFIIGNGIENSPHNAFDVDWEGNVNIGGSAHYKIGGNNLAPKDIGLITGSYVYDNRTSSGGTGQNSSSFSFYDANAVGCTHVVATAQDIAGPITYTKISSGIITIYLTTSVQLIRVNYICF